MSSASSSPSDTPSCMPPDGASCWLCLEEGPDDSGAPLVRDCSCRGHSGFAHVPCLVQYAESKSREFVERELHTTHATMDLFDERFFDQCPNCKQSFQGGILHDMIEAQLSFVERELKEMHEGHLYALMRRIKILDQSDEAYGIEGEGICDKMLALIQDVEKNSDSTLTVFALFSAYESIGSFKSNVNVGTKRSLKKAKYYFEKSRNIIATSGDQDAQWLAKMIDKKLSQVEAKLSGDGDSLPKNAVIDLSSTRAVYNKFLRLYGETDQRTIQFGVAFAGDLFMANHTIEAQRLLDKLVVASRHVHGSSHEQTKSAAAMWKRLKLRCVFIRKDSYQVLRYANDKNMYVVTGPLPATIDLLSESRNLAGEKTFSVPGADVIFSLGTPVMLHGLKKAAHLNGEIGDVREYCNLSYRWVVHLEDKALKPVKVKHANFFSFEFTNASFSRHL